MANEWTTSKRFKGVRWREHATRKHGGKPDRYYMIIHRVAGKRVNESLGWASQNGMSEDKAGKQLSDLKEAQANGEGAFTLKEKKQFIEEERHAKELEKKLEDAKNISFDEIFEGDFKKNSERAESTQKAYNSYYKKWIKPTIGHLSLNNITNAHLQTIKDITGAVPLAPSTMKVIFSIIHNIYEYAKKHEIHEGKNLAGKYGLVELPRVDNKRERYLTEQEVSLLLSTLLEQDEVTYELTLFALNTGFRLGEVLKLKWMDVNFETNLVTARDTKNKETRHVPMNENVLGMFKYKKPGKPSAHIFHSRFNTQYVCLPRVFANVVKELGFNDGITDRRRLITFHSLRHSFASRLVQKGVDIVTVSKLLGHKSLQMTMRYSHLAPSNFDVVNHLNGMKI